MRALVIDPNGEGGLDVAIRAQAAGHQIKYFVRQADKTKHIGRGLVDLVEDWRMYFHWADLVVITGNDVYIRDLENLSRHHRNVAVIAAGQEAAHWEIDRQAGQALLRKHGIATLPSKEFSDYDAAIAHVKKHDKRFVSKPAGDEADKSLSYVSKSPADMVYMLERWKKLGKLKGSFVLQDFVSGIEMGTAGWFGPGGWNEGWEENFEFKKFMNDDLGVATGEQGCYSADTEVLTEAGWKQWPDITTDDKLATLDGGKLKFEYPSKVVCYDYNGFMYHWLNRSIDILVTPNHNMYVAGQSSSRNGNPKFKFVSADKCTESQYRLLRTIPDNEQATDERGPFIIPGRSRNGKHQRSCDPIHVRFREWCWFLGFWFAEGNATYNTVFLAQSHKEKSDKAWSMLKHLPFKIKRDGNGFRIHNKALAQLLRPFGRSYEKRIPQYIKDAHPADIYWFIEGFALGDAHTQDNGSRAFFTSNPGLADDLQELMLRCGRLGIIAQKKAKIRNSYIAGRQIFQRRPAYVIWERARKTRSWLDKRDLERVSYQGKVYCATVKSHLLFVRRNGKPLWCGNTVMRYVRSSKLARKMLVPLTETLEKTGYVGDIDVNCIIDDKGQAWPLEFTCRLGWPAFHLQNALQQGDPLEWLRDLATGKDSRSMLMDKVAVGVVLSIPDYPHSHLTHKEVIGVPIYGLSEALWKHWHPCQMMLADSVPNVIDGRHIRMPMPVTAGDYVGVMTAVADTVKGAALTCYRRLGKLVVPNNAQWRSDIGKRLIKQLPMLQKHGYAMAMEY